MEAIMREQDSFELIETAQGWTVGRFRALAELPDVAHGVTTRQAPLLTADVREPAAIAGMREVAEALGLRKVAWCRQVHGGTVRIVGAGGFQGEADALVTAAPGLGVLGRSADCPLILAVGPAVRAIGGWVVGVAHASWRSTLAGVTGRMIEVLQERFAANPADLDLGICPSAGPCCYEVGEEVRAAALAALGPRIADCFEQREGRLHFDLWRANVMQLRAAGVPEERIHVAGICTICRHDLFPSHRADGGLAARFAALVGLS
jgi:YfiH family protein